MLNPITLDPAWEFNSFHQQWRQLPLLRQRDLHDEPFLLLETGWSLKELCTYNPEGLLT